MSLPVLGIGRLKIEAYLFFILMKKKPFENHPKIWVPNLESADSERVRPSPGASLSVSQPFSI